MPFSVVEQFGHVPDIPDNIRSAVRQLVENGAPAPVRLLRNLACALRSAAGRTHVAILVDDAHFMDAASRSCLLYLARHLRPYGIAITLAFSRTASLVDGGYLEFLGLPDAWPAKAAPLSHEEVRVLLERGLGVRASESLTESVHRVGGGNPALVTALVRDLLSAGPVRTDTQVHIGESFRTAYLALLVRHPGLTRTVEAFAVLGEDATSARAARLLGQSFEDTEHHVVELEHAGLLENGGFRHPAVPGVVLGVLGTDLPVLHRRAASLLFAEGAHATAVARHLVAADEPPDPVGVRVLTHAWHQFLTTGQSDRALACLRLADRADLDERQRAKIVAALVSTWCALSPLGAEPEVRRLSAAARAGHADCHALRLLVIWFLWFGQWNRAREMTAILVGSCHPSHAHDEVRSFGILVDSLWPELLDAPDVRAYVRPDTVDTRTPAEEDSAPAVVDVRRFTGLDFASVLELMHHGELALADRLCQEQCDRVPEGELPARQALLTVLRARIRYHLGDVRAASECAASALALLPDHGWGVAVGAPLAVLVSSHTLMGCPEEAARYLERPVPDEMWESAFGPLYRVARGGYLLEIGRPHAALQDFLACAPSKLSDLVGWRAHAAEAYLALGEVERARRTAAEELAHDGRPSDFRGRALLVLASADGPDRRRGHLEEAERILRAAGNRVLLAQALARLSQEDLADGRTGIARARWSEALSLAVDGGFTHRIRQFTGPLDAAAPWAEPLAAEDGIPVVADPLTVAERRVASLAAAGRSNRQIATQLYITVSTVEQHLTRVYRKLSVRRRSELADPLRLASPLADRRSGRD
ncbi:LuxR C-terminal-related transcriptional regulator [Streptomyces ossamyceticus]|nr:LuxR C-terminal-related transcriptional regulator [Streptomyces ossamyceticus]